MPQPDEWLSDDAHTGCFRPRRQHGPRVVRPFQSRVANVKCESVRSASFQRLRVAVVLPNPVGQVHRDERERNGAE